MPNLKGAIEFMRKACADWSLCYDQSNRWDVGIFDESAAKALQRSLNDGAWG